LAPDDDGSIGGWKVTLLTGSDKRHTYAVVVVVTMVW